MAKKNQFLIDGLFGFDGRFRRSEYWIASIGLTIVRMVVLLVICGVLGKGLVEASRMPLVRHGLDLLFLWPAAAITIKRGHDRNRSTLFTSVMLAVLYGAGGVITFLGLSGNQLAVGAFSLLMLPFMLYMFIDYGLIDGTNGDNRYGRSPKATSTNTTLTLD
ncbi:DUF805 domain-containing protein [Caulobacter sp. FWC2]|uniref:DUF805 domain-containing protein n=1 Tax=Caulobacter sp. FWC2 TaxID=69664 RepID=UPI000C14A2AA|nr:DUF805 domain-containing protein [Caulobacter sp. FWC2]PIB91512.1 hypothetical protein CSW62_07945 [Caulobacter sp. FWC2]